VVIDPVAEHWIGDQAVLFPPGDTPQKIAGLEIRVAGYHHLANATVIENLLTAPSIIPYP